MRQYVKQRKWKLVLQVEEVGSGSKQRPKREELLKAARRREVDAIVVWKLDRWGRHRAGEVRRKAISCENEDSEVRACRHAFRTADRLGVFHTT
jgi:DNA invertase Pin-like site-specific DNA recombinase